MPVRMSQPGGQKLVVSVGDFNVDPTGTVESTLGFSQALTKVANSLRNFNGGGGGPTFPAHVALYIPNGFYITDGFDLPGQFGFDSFFSIFGEDRNTVYWKLKNGANKSLISGYASSINNLATYGSAPSTAMHDFSLSKMTLYGNYLNQSGISYPIQFYAYGYDMDNITIFNGFSGGMQCDYHNIFPTFGQLEGRLSNIRIAYNNDIGLKWYGPSDSMWRNLDVNTSGSHNVHIAGANATGLQDVTSHYYFPGQGNNSVCGLIESNVSFVGSEFEGSDTAQMVVNAQNISFYGGAIFGGGHNGTGAQIGQAGGLTPYNESINQSAGLTTYTNPNGYIVDTFFSNIINNSNGIIKFGNDGAGTIRGFVQAFGSTTPTIVGTPNANTRIDLQVWDGNGQYTINKTPTIQVGNASTMLSGIGVPSNSIGANGDYYFRQDTPGTANQRLYVKAAGAWSGIV